MNKYKLIELFNNSQININVNVNINVNIDELHDIILHACTKGDKRLLANVLTFIKNWNIDLDIGYCDGLYGIIAVRSGFISIIDLLVKHDDAFLKHYGNLMLKCATETDKTECVKYLLSKRINPLPLKGKTSWNKYIYKMPLLVDYLSNNND